MRTMAPPEPPTPTRDHRQRMAELRRVRDDHPRGSSAGWGSSKVSMCVVSEELSARLYRRRARSAPARRSRPEPDQLGGGTDDAEAEVPARHRVRRHSAHRRSSRSRTCGSDPGPAGAPKRRSRARSWRGERNKPWNTHPGPRRPDDHARAHQHRGAGPQGSVDPARPRRAAADDENPLPPTMDVGRRDRGARYRG